MATSRKKPKPPAASEPPAAPEPKTVRPSPDWIADRATFMRWLSERTMKANPPGWFRQPELQDAINAITAPSAADRELLHRAYTGSFTVTLPKAQHFEASASVRHQEYHDRRTEAEADALTDLIEELRRAGMLEIHEKKDNVLERVTFTFGINVVPPDSAGGSRRAPSAVYAGGVDEGLRKGLTAALSIIEELQDQILPETTGPYVANLLWFRINEALEKLKRGV